MNITNHAKHASEGSHVAMRRGIVVRRLIHCLMALAPAYYLVPVDVPIIGVRRWVLLIAFFAAIAAVEAIRLPKGILFLGMRPHEKNQIASFAWAAAGVTATLWLFPHYIATGAIVGWALVDPLAGELRSRGVRTRSNTALSSLVYFAICGTILLLASSRSVTPLLILAVVGTLAAVASEQFKNAYVDDDFLMLVVPGLAMTLLALVP